MKRWIVFIEMEMEIYKNIILEAFFYGISDLGRFAFILFGFIDIDASIIVTE